MFINIEVERLRRFMSRAKMARALAISSSTLDEWIRQKKPIPAEGLRALSRLFEGCSIDYLLKERPYIQNLCTVTQDTYGTKTERR